ncbi:hypothetical protein CpipJ_CPIJ005795 [Culex quinquefasciatus]|uniref:Uncharacterized protein n=1 Tax=Culex quinquefasciatus TaxID=7176 RepID=B0WEZ5_CULQU|nr:hypothetical protein CpipJ_CPIJ005795 [Culex quinquefasciatus]|eukprot:XP_001847279.1 hypothetical protein CpipJ_CPIJ005795 [Culex quinquefasciatus]
MIRARNFRNIDQLQLQADFQAKDLRRLFGSADINEKATVLNSELTSLLDAHAPERTVTIRDERTPWITQQIKEAVELRNLALKLYARNPNRTRGDVHSGFGSNNRVTNLCNEIHGVADGHLSCTQFCSKEFIQTALAMNETLFRNCHVVVNPKHNNQLLRGIRSRPSDRRCNTLDQTLPLVRSASLPEQIRTGHTSTKVCHRMFAGELCLRFQQLKNLGLTHQPDQQLLTHSFSNRPLVSIYPCRSWSASSLPSTVLE